MLIGSSQYELGLWMGRHLFRVLMLSASFVSGDFLRLTRENLFSGVFFSPEKVPIVFCLERWRVMFKPGC